MVVAIAIAKGMDDQNSVSQKKGKYSMHWRHEI